MNATDLLRLTYDVALKVRIIREYEKARIAAEEELSERELLALEVISTFSPVNESQLGRVLGLQTSSLAELIKRLIDKTLIEKSKSDTDQRQRTLRLTKKGRLSFDRIKRKTAVKYWYLLPNCIQPEELERFARLLKQMNKNVDKEANRVIFGRQPEYDDLPLDRLLGLPSQHSS